MVTKLKKTVNCVSVLESNRRRCLTQELTIITFIFNFSYLLYILTTDWMVQDRILVEMRFSACPDRPWGPPSLL